MLAYFQLMLEYACIYMNCGTRYDCIHLSSTPQLKPYNGGILAGLLFQSICHVYIEMLFAFIVKRYFVLLR